MTSTTSLLLLGLFAGALGQSCVARCGIYDAGMSCQCTDECSQNGNCCSDYEAVCMSCKNRCGESYHPSSPCVCTDECLTHNNCCQDYTTVCLSCQGRCGETYVSNNPCHCNDQCTSHNNCCQDYNAVCGGGGGQGVTDDDLRAITEAMIAADVNNVYDQLTLDYQGKGSSGDLAPGPLFASVPASALSGPTISLLMKVQDNYIASVSQPEVQPAAEVAEQNAFLNAIMNTEVMKLAENFLHSKNLLTGSLRDKLFSIWFTLYDRGSSSSSGFEHTFVGELKGGVSGFHNWVHFQKEEAEGDLDYFGWSKSLKLGTKGEVLMDRFEWLGQDKSYGSMLVGTSPELEMATYTVCFLARPNALCPVQMSGQKFHVQTWTINGNLVGSAYPDA